MSRTDSPATTLSDAEPGDTAIVAFDIEHVGISDGGQRYVVASLGCSPSKIRMRCNLAADQIRSIEKAPKPLKVGDRVDIGDLYWHDLPVDGMTREQLLVVVKRLMTKDIFPTV